MTADLASRAAPLYELSESYVRVLDLLDDQDADAASLDAELDQLAAAITHKADHIAAPAGRAPRGPVRTGRRRGARRGAASGDVPLMLQAGITLEMLALAAIAVRQRKRQLPVYADDEHVPGWVKAWLTPERHYRWSLAICEPPPDERDDHA